MAKSDNEEKKNADKAALIQDTIAKIEKLYGKGSGTNRSSLSTSSARAVSRSIWRSA